VGGRGLSNNEWEEEDDWGMHESMNAVEGILCHNEETTSCWTMTADQQPWHSISENGRV